MTGFGRGVAEHATVDVRAVNHRFLDLKLRGEPVAPGTEEAIGARVRGAIERGSIVVSIRLVREGAGGPRIDEAAARAAHAALAQLARELGTAPPELALVLAQPGVVAAPEANRDGDGPAILAALDAALAELGRMRAAEGVTLARELTARLAELAGRRDAIARL
ncbi:MAG TPA: YicC/YloC family endoribonuclease, partial [Kofleriaceae bacterium]